MFDESALNASMQGIPDLQMLSDDLAGSVDPLAEGFGIPQSTEPGLCAAEPGLNGDFSWEMISLGLEEPLPTQDVIDELYVTLRTLYSSSTPLIGSLQHGDLFRQGVSHHGDHPSSPLFCCYVLGSQHATSCLFALYYVVYSCLTDSKILILTRTFLYTRTKVRPS